MVYLATKWDTFNNTDDDSLHKDIPDADSKKSEAHKMVPRSIQVVDHVVENSNKSSSSQRFIPYNRQRNHLERTLLNCLWGSSRQRQTFHHDKPETYNLFQWNQFWFQIFIHWWVKYHPQNKLNVQQQVSIKWRCFRCCFGFKGENISANIKCDFFMVFKPWNKIRIWIFQKKCEEFIF